VRGGTAAKIAKRETDGQKKERKEGRGEINNKNGEEGEVTIGKA